LSGRSINKLIAMIAMILEEAQERDGWGPGPSIARGHRRKAKTEKPRRTFLEGDAAARFVLAARHIDRCPIASSEEPFIETMRLRDDEKLPWREVARRTRVGLSTAHYRYRVAKAPHDIGPWEAMAIMLLASGMRATECGDMTLEDLAVLDRHFVVPGTKTASAHRTSDMTDGVYERMTQFVHTRRHDDPKSPAFPNAQGKSRDRHSVGWFVERVASRARLLAERDGLPFPRHVTPHDLRRTCVALLLSPPHPYDLAFVKEHVGNTSSELVLDIYNQLREHADRSAPAAEFDRILFSKSPKKPEADGQNGVRRSSST
jgi:integrase